MIRQILLALLANLTSLGVSSLTLFLIPRWLSVSQYNYFQLYLFYAAYLPYLHFGLADGIYLRYGGYSFAQLDHRRLAGQFWFLGGLCLTLSLGLVILTHNLLFQYLALALLLTVPKIWISYLLQTTGKIDAYTRLTLTEKLSYAFSVLLFGLGGGLNVTRLIGLDLISRLAGLLYAGYLARTILFSRPPSWSVLRIELKENWLDGSKLMLATISGALMIGLVRWGIEKEWDLYTFGQVSLALSMANLLTVLIQAMSMVLFPVLKRLSPEKLAAWYPLLRNALMFALVFLLVIYYPLEQFIAFWLPQYQDSLVYLALLFPLCLFESKMSLLINTYLKALRQEKVILRANLYSLAFSFLLGLYAMLIVHHLTLAVLNIVIVYAFRCLYCEYQLQKSIPFVYWKDWILELGLVSLFILSNLTLNRLFALSLYLCALIIYLLCKKKDYLQSWQLYRKEYRHALH